MMRSTWHTARTPKLCDEYRGCDAGNIQPGQRYQRSVASPHDPELGNEHWWVLNHCSVHMRREPGVHVPAASGVTL